VGCAAARCDAAALGQVAKATAALRALVSDEAAATVAFAEWSEASRAARLLLERALPFLELLEAGVFAIWPREGCCIALPRPSVAWEEGRIHRWDGEPAVRWPVRLRHLRLARRPDARQRRRRPGARDAPAELRRDGQAFTCACRRGWWGS
jgi:hypothetical protein